MAEHSRGYDSDLLRGNTDSLLLFLINEHGQTYGYRLIKEIEERSHGYFRFKEGTVYPGLAQAGERRSHPGGVEEAAQRTGAALLHDDGAGTGAAQQKLVMWQSFASAMALVMKPTEG